MKIMGKATLNIKLEQTLHGKIKAEAAKQGMTMAQYACLAFQRKLRADEKIGGDAEPKEVEPQVKAAVDKFVLALFPLVGEFYRTPTKVDILPEFHIYTEGNLIGIWPIFPDSPHFQFPKKLEDEG